MRSLPRTRPIVRLSALLLCGLALGGCSQAETPWSRTATPVSIPAPPAALAGDRDAVASHCLSWAANRTEQRSRGTRDRAALDIDRPVGGLRDSVDRNSALRERDRLFRACMSEHAPRGPAPAA
jgi:hypothetical protein